MNTAVHTIYKTKDGKRVPSVTTILGILNKPALMNWAWKCGIEGQDYKLVRDKSSGIGTLTHALILANLTETKCDTSGYSKEDIESSEVCYKSFLEWKRLHKINVVYAEKYFVSEAHRFGGTIDLFAEVDRLPTLVDFKTSGGIYPEAMHQVAAYKKLLEEYGHKVDRVKILRIGKLEDDLFEDLTLGNLDNHWKIFLACKEIYELRKAIKKE